MPVQTLQGMQDDAVGSAAATLLHQLLLHLKDDLTAHSGQSVSQQATPPDLVCKQQQNVFVSPQSTAKF